ncbi:MAG TPA: Uma2 family endonuclease [Planctomycetaceae bacterium]|nr:Uma2 family endonuclease [Planctomycetaceae bacterium]
MLLDTDQRHKVWTAAQLAERFGAMPLWRIVHDPLPGLATEQDVVRLEEHENRLCELVDGVLVEKTMGWYESWMAMRLGRLLSDFVDPRQLGLILGTDGLIRLMPNLVRIPDVSFVSYERLRGRDFDALLEDALMDSAPDLAAEILSRSNTRKEMQRKLEEYFDCGVRLVWFVDPKKQHVRVYTSLSECTTLRKSDVLDGGKVLPGIRLKLTELFINPLAPPDPEHTTDSP